MLRALIKNNAGLFLIVASEVFYALMNVSVKVLTTHWQEELQVPIVTYVFSVVYMLCAKINQPILGPPGVRWLLMSRGFFGFVGVFGIYHALQYLSLSDSIVLTLLTPLCTAVGGLLFLEEKFSRREALAGSCSNDNDETIGQRTVAVCTALLSVLGTSVAYVSIRAIGKRAHSLHSMTYFSFWSVVMSSVVLIATRTPIVIPRQESFVYMLFLIGIFGFIVQTLMTIGYQIEAAGRASMGIYSQVVFGVILERLVFGTVPGLLSILGTCLILSSGLRDYQNNVPPGLIRHGFSDATWALIRRIECLRL
ncbi:drug/metabolite transporter superfamily, partial [Amanita rubescens]